MANRAALGLVVALVGCGGPSEELRSWTLASGADCEALAQTLAARASEPDFLDDHGGDLDALARFRTRLLQERSSEPETRACSSAYGALLRRLALAHHEHARLLRSFRLARRAESLFERYLNAFGDRADAYEARYSYAQLLWSLDRVEEAGDHYRLVALQDPSRELSEPAARAAVRARWSYRLCGDPEPEPSGRPIPMSHWVKKDLDAYDLYLRHFPDTELASTVRYRRARMLFDHNRFGEAAEGYEALVRRTPPAALSPHTAAAYLASLRRSGTSAAAWARAFRQMPWLMAEDWQNNGVREEVALALGEPVPEPVSAPRWNGKVPDVIPGLPGNPPFLPQN